MNKLYRNDFRVGKPHREMKIIAFLIAAIKHFCFLVYCICGGFNINTKYRLYVLVTFRWQEVTKGYSH